MSLGFYNSLAPSVRPTLRTVKGLKFEVANDGLLDVSGIATFKFKIKKDEFKWDMYVAPIREDGLLGLDFLFKNNFSLGTNHGLRLNGKKYPTVIETAPYGIARVKSKDCVTVPSNSEIVVHGYVTNIAVLQMKQLYRLWVMQNMRETDF